MAFETPYGKPEMKPLPVAACCHEEGADQRNSSAGRWTFPSLIAPPQSLQGEMILTTGSLHEEGWEIGWAQIIGKKHRICEDSMGVAWVDDWPTGQSLRPVKGVSLVLADGVGGGARGDIASHALVQHCLDLGTGTSSPATLSAGLAQADSAVNKALATLTTMPGAATLAAAWIDPAGRGWISRVGDARLSVMQAATGQWQPVMADQSYANLGEPPPMPDQLHAPARMVGAGLMGAPELVPFALQPGDVLMLSSDGLHEWLGDAKEKTGRPSAEARLVDRARMLGLRSRENGSEDDISVLLLRMSPH